ncbi:RNA-binding protein [Candidatus Pacearchaeota archaeon CG_4_10_14_0_2_um_filter_31_10]|nr:MAG: RNA-binding protein [Candidatus Pacearchaeota archaeon CG_4_10_14_0_2_um_filter_31_10]
MIIEKKTWPIPFQSILDGAKTFDVRLADFDARPGDTLVLKEFDPTLGQYTGREIKKEITYIQNTKDAEFWTNEEIERYGLQVFAFK